MASFFILLLLTIFCADSIVISVTGSINDLPIEKVIMNLKTRLETLEGKHKTLQQEVTVLRASVRTLRGGATEVVELVDEELWIRLLKVPVTGRDNSSLSCYLFNLSVPFFLFFSPYLCVDCTPGTLGCPVNVTPYSVGGSCILCPAGARGYAGPAGPAGRDGRDGRDAIAVVTSTQEGGIPVMTSQRGQSYHSGPPRNDSGAVFIRWGHKKCPSSSTLVYAGVAAGARYGSSGNGANQLCLPGDPIYDEPVSGVGSTRAFLYSIEYQIDSFHSMSDRTWHDVPCAVCQSPSRYSMLMMPAKNACPSEDWTLEYGGYLMAERSYSSHMRSMYICVDRELQTRERTHGLGTDHNRGLLDLVESRCVVSGGGLPCSPYVDGYELTCAVCTQ
ncbi:putative short-chain collagen C4 [Apostichopus japonicus]|uniref:Putative short-chain collagen C4 n=1 Tax=Stichopus japonicus TaxID=307972 RepID=A0A2G8JR78_STIJA|nr:putative short-chain collagen C4 [Apostichopus japonicus]